MAGLKNYLPADLSYEKFDKVYKLQSKTVLPSISDDLKKGAVKATVFLHSYYFSLHLYTFPRLALLNGNYCRPFA
ncbi:MAG: hypothetical protein WDO19_03345 [Bacteroidota bacterium]